MLLSQDQKWTSFLISTKTCSAPASYLELLWIRVCPEGGHGALDLPLRVHFNIPPGENHLSLARCQRFKLPAMGGCWATDLLAEVHTVEEYSGTEAYFKLTHSIFKHLWWPHQQWDLFAMDSWCQNELKKNCQRPQFTKCLQTPWPWVAPWYLNIGSTLLRTVKSVGDTWFSWMS